MRPSRQNTIDLSSLGDSPRLRRKDSLLSDKDSFTVHTQLVTNKQINENEIQDQLNNYRVMINHEEQIQKENSKVEKQDFVLLAQEIRNINNEKRERLIQLNEQLKVTNTIHYLQSFKIISPEKTLSSQISTQQSVISHNIENDVIENKIQDEISSNAYLKEKANYLRVRISKHQMIINNLKSTILLVNQTLAGFSSNDQSQNAKLAESYLHQLTTNLEEEQKSRQEIIARKKEFMEKQKQQLYYQLKLEEEAYQKRILLEKKLENQLLGQIKKKILNIIEIEEHQTAIREKFNLIQRCAEFLDQLDDFDKLALIFIYDSPQNFNLDEIYQILIMQLNRPKEQYQKQSLEEFLERLRFNQVSIRMNLFIRFHKNDLHGLVSQLVKVFKELQSQETLLNYRFQDLLNELQSQNAQLGLYDRLIYQYQHNLIPNNEIHHIEDVPDDQELKQEIKVIQQSFFKFEYFLLESYIFTVLSLSRFLNTFQAISEILKSCKNEDFELSFYINAIYNKLFEIIKKEELTKILDRQFQIKLINNRANMRHSNLILNTFFDQIESKIIHQLDRKNIRRRQRQYNIQRDCDLHMTQKIAQLVAKYFPQNENYERRLITEQIKQDTILIQLSKLSDIEEILQNSQFDDPGIPFTCIIDKVQYESRNFKRENYQKKIVILFNHIKTIFQSTTIEPNFTFIEHIYKKYNLYEQMDKINTQFQTNFKYDIKNQTRATIQSKITQLETYKGKIGLENEDQNEILQESGNSHRVSNEVLRLKKKQIDNVDLNLMHHTLQSIKKDLLQISLQQKPSNKANMMNIVNTPIFNHLNAKHRKNKKNTESLKININTIASTLKIDGIDSPGRNSYRSNLGTRRNMNYSKNQSPLQQGSSELPSIDHYQNKIPQKFFQNSSKILIQDDYKSQYFIKYSKSKLSLKESTQQSGVGLDSFNHASSSYLTKSQDLFKYARSHNVLPNSYMFPLKIEKRKIERQWKPSILNEYFGNKYVL